MATPFAPVGPKPARFRALVIGLLCLGAGAPTASSAQSVTPVTRLERIGVERIELDGLTLFYSSVRPRGLETEARRTGAFLASAVGFFAERLGPGLHVSVAVLNPADFGLMSRGRPVMPFSLPVDRLVVIPALEDGFGAASARDDVAARQVRDIIQLHELGHAVAAAYLYPEGFTRERPPVRWFDELVASYLAHAYMRAEKPELADFAERLARDVVRHGSPHFTTLEAFDEYHDSYMATPQGGPTLGWFQNAFNLRAAELYDEHGLDFFRSIRSDLPWMRFELWTTDSLLRDLQKIDAGFLGWADELEYLSPRP